MGSEMVLVDDTAVIEYVLDLEKGGAIDAVSLTLVDPEMSYERWESLGRFLGRVDRATRWWLGDWLNFGEAVFGEESSQAVESTVSERYSQAEQVTGLDHGTLMNIRSVCARVARTRRRAELGFWIHSEVAALEPDEQVEWLERAVAEGLTKSDLRAAIRDAKTGGPPPPAEPPAAEGGDGLTISQRIEAAARLIFHQGQRTSDGSVLVSAEAWAQLGAALGEE